MNKGEVAIIKMIKSNEQLDPQSVNEKLIRLYCIVIYSGPPLGLLTGGPAPPELFGRKLGLVCVLKNNVIVYILSLPLISTIM